MELFDGADISGKSPENRTDKWNTNQAENLSGDKYWKGGKTSLPLSPMEDWGFGDTDWKAEYRDK